MRFNLGLTGSIGMGKSTTAALFRDEGCAVWDADAAVHRLYAYGGAAVSEIEKRMPNAIEGGAVSRAKLKRILEADPDRLQIIERIVHPLVRQDRQAFSAAASEDIRVFDIPLLYETGSEAEFDAIACVFVDVTEQRRRVLDRGTMTEDQLAFILSKQLPIAEKKARADYLIETDTVPHARQQVQDIVRDIRKKH